MNKPGVNNPFHVVSTGSFVSAQDEAWLERLRANAAASLPRRQPAVYIPTCDCARSPGQFEPTVANGDDACVACGHAVVWTREEP